MIKKLLTHKLLYLSIFILATLAWFLQQGIVYQSQTEPPKLAPAPEKLEEAFFVEVVEPEFISKTKKLRLSGLLQPHKIIDVVSQKRAIVESRLEASQFVQENQTLLKLENTTEQASYSQAQAALDKIELEWQALLELEKKDPSLISQFEKKSLLAELESAKATRALAMHQLSLLEVKAPFSGYLESTFVEQGELVSPNQKVARILQTSPSIVRAALSQAELETYKLGSKVRVFMESSRVQTGRISEIKRYANEKTKTFDIEIEIANSKNSLLNYNTQVEIELESRPQKNLVKIPNSLLQINDQGEYFVSLVQDLEAPQVVEQQVELFAIENNWFYILGIPQGAFVINRGAGYVQAGDKVSYTLKDSTSP